MDGNEVTAKPERRVAVVTGAGRGIGAAIARRLDADGFSVALWDVDPAAVGAVAASLTQAVAIAVDITDRGSIAEGLRRTIDAIGPVDTFVNNAGIDVVGPFLSSSEDDWQRIISVNLVGLFNCCKAILPNLIERGGGTIINLGSDAGRVGSSGEAVYSATKGGVIAFTKTLAREHARHGITVNCVCPGPTDTALLDQVAAASKGLYDGLAKAIPMRRIAAPDDIAKVVSFLASGDAAYMTGQTLSVSGGLTMS
ncbi:MAG: SDR family NAD(P)-dependent oxidoreductase [Acidimicrobiia bacterium]